MGSNNIGKTLAVALMWSPVFAPTLAPILIPNALLSNKTIFNGIKTAIGAQVKLSFSRIALERVAKMPTMEVKDAMDLVSRNLSKDNLSHFYNLSIKLGMCNVADAIKHDYSNVGIEEIILQLLLTWKKRNGNKATVPVLARALQEINHKDLAQKIYPDIANQVTQDNSRRQNRMNSIEPDGISTSTCHNSANIGEQAATAQVPMDWETAMFTVQNNLNSKNLSRLATKLGLPDTVVDENRHNYPNAKCVQIHKLLINWKQRKGNNATVHALAEALVEIEEVIIAQEIYPGIKIPVNVNGLEAIENISQSSTSPQPQATDIESHETGNRQGANENDLRQRPPRESLQNSQRPASEQEATNTSNAENFHTTQVPQEANVKSEHDEDRNSDPLLQRQTDNNASNSNGELHTNSIKTNQNNNVEENITWRTWMYNTFSVFFPFWKPVAFSVVAIPLLFAAYGIDGIHECALGVAEYIRSQAIPRYLGFLLAKIFFWF